MTIKIQNLHPNVQTLASIIVDAKHNGTSSIQVDALDDIQKRFLMRHEIEYSFNREDKNWEIITK